MNAGRVDLILFSLPGADLEYALHGHDLLEKMEPSLRLPWVATHQEEEIRRTRMSARDFQPDQEASLVIDLLAQATQVDGSSARLKDAWKADDMRSATIESLRLLW